MKYIFSRVTIIGVGAIGGSIGLAVKARKIARHVIGIDSDVNVLEAALRLGAVDYAVSDIGEGINGFLPSVFPDGFYNTEGDVVRRHKPEIVIIATPVSLVSGYVIDVANVVRNDDFLRNILITDVASTKETICSKFYDLYAAPLPNDCRFIGSHPIAGTEKSGVINGDADLFVNRLVVITPYDGSRELDIAMLLRFWQSLGAMVVSMSHTEHDRVLARTSHLPHLISALLAGQLRNNDAKYTGTGFRSTTRIAAGKPAIWKDVIENNTEAILEAIKEYEDGLKILREYIEQKEWNKLTDFLEKAKNNRDALR
ncbi:MAG: prephenate dehydrogenase/arogenate dehydrogenase family protein [Planctomycetaceae bacterium]|jgi:prephenate dehydrogenase|nr:prephenate dehydrogenase/arogenate dehydrogenase family protein [Planctomycetaceae bacterium]